MIDPLILSTISVILVLVVLTENTYGLWKITQGVKSIQDGQKEIVKAIQSGQKEIIKAIQDGNKAVMEALERISERLKS